MSTKRNVKVQWTLDNENTIWNESLFYGDGVYCISIHGRANDVLILGITDSQSWRPLYQPQPLLRMLSYPIFYSSSYLFSSASDIPKN